jgi:hypothetical protein
VGIGIGASSIGEGFAHPSTRLRRSKTNSIPGYRKKTNLLNGGVPFTKRHVTILGIHQVKKLGMYYTGGKSHTPFIVGFSHQPPICSAKKT